MSIKKRSFAVLCGLVVLTGMIVFLVHVISPSEIVQLLGVQNGYLVMFLVAFFGGISTFTSSSYFATLFAFGAGGLHPLMIALIAGTALTLGDSLVYFVGSKGRDHIPLSLEVKFEKVSRILARYPQNRIKLLIFAYTGLTPLPADLLMLFLSFLRYPYKKVVIPLLIGNILLAFIISSIGYIGLGT